MKNLYISNKKITDSALQIYLDFFNQIKTNPNIEDIETQFKFILDMSDTDIIDKNIMNETIDILIDNRKLKIKKTNIFLRYFNKTLSAKLYDIFNMVYHISFIFAGIVSILTLLSILANKQIIAELYMINSFLLINGLSGLILHYFSFNSDDYIIVDTNSILFRIIYIITSIVGILLLLFYI